MIEEEKKHKPTTYCSSCNSNNNCTLKKDNKEKDFCHHYRAAYPKMSWMDSLVLGKKK